MYFEYNSCFYADIQDEPYWDCYWNNVGCEELTGESCWYTMFWYNTCIGDEPLVEDYDKSWVNYLACQAVSPSYTTKEAERLECD